MAFRTATLVAALLLLFAVPTAAFAQEIWVSHPLKGEITIHDPQGTALETISMEAAPGSMALSPDGSTIVVAGYSSARVDVLDAASRSSRFVLELNAANLEGGDVAFTPDGAYLWYVGVRGVEIYSVPDYQLVRIVKLHTTASTQLAAAPEGMYVTEKYSGRYWLWPFDGSGDGFERGRRMLPGGIAATGGNVLLADGSAGGITVTAPDDEAETSVLPLGDLDYPGARLVVSPSGGLVANLQASRWPSIVDLATGDVTTVKLKRCPTRDGAFVNEDVLAVTCLNRYIALVKINAATKQLVSVTQGDSFDVVVRR